MTEPNSMTSWFTGKKEFVYVYSYILLIFMAESSRLVKIVTGHQLFRLAGCQIFGFFCEIKKNFHADSQEETYFSFSGFVKSPSCFFFFFFREFPKETESKIILLWKLLLTSAKRTIILHPITRAFDCNSDQRTREKKCSKNEQDL